MQCPEGELSNLFTEKFKSPRRVHRIRRFLGQLHIRLIDTVKSLLVVHKLLQTCELELFEISSSILIRVAIKHILVKKLFWFRYKWLQSLKRLEVVLRSLGCSKPLETDQTNDAKTWDSSYDGDAIEWSGDFLGVNQRNRCLDRFGESLAGDNRSSWPVSSSSKSPGLKGVWFHQEQQGYRNKYPLMTRSPGSRLEWDLSLDFINLEKLCLEVRFATLNYRCTNTHQCQIWDRKISTSYTKTVIQR